MARRLRIQSRYCSSEKLNLPVDTVSTDELEATIVYPDIIVHHRKEPGANHNLLVIEAKKGNAAPLDRQKLDAFVSVQVHYLYRFGLFIGFNKVGVHRLMLYEPNKPARDSQSDEELAAILARCTGD